MKPFKEAFRKLRAETSHAMLMVNAPDNYLAAVRAQFGNITINTAGTGMFDFIQLFAQSKLSLEQDLPPLLNKLQNKGLIWVCYPKKSSGAHTDLNRNDSWTILEKTGYRIVTQVSIDDTWSALRLKPIAEVPITKKKENTPFINYEKRTVTAPADLQAALQHAGLTDAFHRMSFTHKREHVEAIEEAKKPETRARRIEKAIDMIKQK